MSKSLSRMVSDRVGKVLRARISYPLARGYGASVAGAINLASNENPYGPSPRALGAIRREAARVSSYPDPSGMELKRAIGRYLGVRAECVAIGNGSVELLDLACKAFLNPGEKALIPLPTFAMYEIACAVNGGVPEFYELPNFEWRVDGLGLALSGVKLAFMGRPNNPTGNSISLKGLRELLQGGKLILIDEAYAEFAGYSVAKLAAKLDNMLVLRTFSKAFGLAGLRVGYAVGDPELIEVLEGIRDPFSVNSLAQAAAVAALEDRGYLHKVLNAIKGGRAYLRLELLKLGMRVLPSDANFLMADVSTLGVSATEFCDSLAERNILVRDLSGFRGAGRSHVRITVGTPRQNEKLVQTLENLSGGEKWS